MTRKALYVLLLGLVAGIALPAHAQDADPAEAPPVSTESPTEPAAEDATQETRVPSPPPREEFEPSEQISEDLSVSFPVDI